MKNTLILFLFLPLLAFGQNEVVSDTTYLKWENNAWYRVISQTYDNGNIQLYQNIIGDTATLYSQTIDGIRNATSSMATDVSTTSQYSKRVRELLKASDEVLAKAGKNPVDSLEKQDAAQFLQDGWIVRAPDGTKTAITFNQQATGRLRYQFVTATNRQVDLIGSVIRLRDFPTTGVVTDFYKVPNGKRYINLDGSYRLIPKGGTPGQKRQ